MEINIATSAENLPCHQRLVPSSLYFSFFVPLSYSNLTITSAACSKIDKPRAALIKRIIIATYSTAYTATIVASLEFILRIPYSLHYDMIKNGPSNNNMHGKWAKMYPYDAC